MTIGTNTINLVRNVLTPLCDAGAITPAEFGEFMTAATQGAKPLLPKAPSTLIKRVECAKVLGVSTRTLDRLLKENIFHPIKVGRRSIRISQTELENFIQVSASVLK